MDIAPHGSLTEGQKRLTSGIMTPMYEWPGTIEEFRREMTEWLTEIESHIWPRWVPGSGWQGASDAFAESDTRFELEKATELYHGSGNHPDILEEMPDIPEAPDKRQRDHLWHYRVEDAWNIDVRFKFAREGDPEEPTVDFQASDGGGGSNIGLYLSGEDKKGYKRLIWLRMRGVQPPLFDIKGYFQRPRPWALATKFGLSDFRWHMAEGYVHTGLHPSLLSGHCIQGILGGCTIFDAVLDDIKRGGEGLSYDEIRGLQKYMVDYGDRRVFAGVHYMTDNIASWTLARRLIPHLFRNGEKVLNFAVGAIVGQSRVFNDLMDDRMFPETFAFKRFLKARFPEGGDPSYGTRSR